MCTKMINLKNSILKLYTKLNVLSSRLFNFQGFHLEEKKVISFSHFDNHFVS